MKHQEKALRGRITEGTVDFWRVIYKRLAIMSRETMTCSSSQKDSLRAGEKLARFIYCYNSTSLATFANRIERKKPMVSLANLGPTLLPRRVIVGVVSVDQPFIVDDLAIALGGNEAAISACDALGLVLRKGSNVVAALRIEAARV